MTKIIYICDRCGKEKEETNGRRNLPTGWSTPLGFDFNKILCTKCSEEYGFLKEEVEEFGERMIKIFWKNEIRRKNEECSTVRSLHAPKNGSYEGKSKEIKRWYHNG